MKKQFFWVCVLPVIAVASCDPKGSSSNEITYSAEQTTTEPPPVDSMPSPAVVQQNNYAVSIRTVLETDDNLTATSNGNYDVQAEAMRRIDLSQCPNDFATAYVDHIHAWEYAAKIKRAQKELNSDDNIKAVLASQLFSELFGTASTPVADAIDAGEKLRTLANDASAQISSTYDNVEHVAASYGAQLIVK